MWYRMANVSVSSSRCEGLPFNVIEAMYMGLPVVASCIKGHTDLITDGETGLLYPYGDANKCAECICQLSNNTAKREALSKHSTKILNSLSLSTVLPSVMQFYQSAL